MKICNKCKQERPLEQFHKDKTRNDGLNPKCKSCIKQYNKQQYQENPEYYEQYRKQWYQDNPEYNKQYNQNNYERKQQSTKKHHSSIQPGVYMIKCLLNGDYYIGESTQPYRRRTEHFSKRQSKEISNTNPKLQADLKQYGKNAFVFGIIEHCKSEQLSEREKYWIQNLNPTYNTKLN